jgi:DNA-binding NarL/FixJ family response regulator
MRGRIKQSCCSRVVITRVEVTCAAIMYRPKNVPDIAKPFSELSDREQQVIALVCNGLSNKEIADRLVVSAGTIKNHLDAIYEELGVRSRIELMRNVAY